MILGQISYNATIGTGNRQCGALTSYVMNDARNGFASSFFLRFFHLLETKPFSIYTDILYFWERFV